MKWMYIYTKSMRIIYVVVFKFVCGVRVFIFAYPQILQAQRGRERGRGEGAYDTYMSKSLVGV